MSADAECQTIVIIGLSGAGFKTFNLLLNHLYNAHRRSPSTTKAVRLIAIEKSKYAYWPPGSLRAAVVDGFEEKIVRTFDHIIPLKIKKNYPEHLVKVVTGRTVVQLDVSNRVLVLDQSLDPFGIEGGTSLHFDYLVIGSGSTYAFPCRPPPDAETPESVKSELRKLQEDIKHSKSIMIVGAGVVGIELAGEVSSKYKDKQIHLICSTPALLPAMNKNLAKSLENQLLGRKVHIYYNAKVDLTKTGIQKTKKLDQPTKIELLHSENGSHPEVEADFVFLATGNKPNTEFIPNEYLNPTNRLIKVNDNLQMIEGEGDSKQPISGIYGVGDAIDFAEAKLYAALDGQAATVSKNLIIDLSAKTSSEKKVVHKPVKDTIVIPLGPCGGASEISGFTFGLGPLMTSLAKGLTLFIWMFKSMYPDKSA